MFQIFKSASIAILAFVILGVALLQAAPYCFDLGPAESPLAADFSPLTAKGSELAQWQAKSRLDEKSHPVERDWSTNASSGRGVPPIYRTELNCDFLSSAESTVLTLAVPPGKYRVWALLGHPGGNRQQIWTTELKSDIGSDAASIIGALGMRQLELPASADAQGLRLQINTKSKWLLNALVVVPEAEWPRVKEELVTPHWQDASMLPREVLEKWKRLDKTPQFPEPDWSDQQKQDGFALYHRHWAEPVWPTQFPRVQELNAPVRAFVSQNEYEPLTFTLYPLKDFSQIDISLGPLRNERGDTLPSADIDLRYVRYMFVRPNYSQFNTYYEAPDVLMPWRPQSLSQGRNLRIWLTVKAAIGTPEGFYRGEVSLNLDGQKHQVPVCLRVLPIVLQKDQDLVFGQYYRHPVSSILSAPDDYSRQWWRNKAYAEMEHLRESGMNALTAGIWGNKKDGIWRQNFENMQNIIDLQRAYGFDKAQICSFNVSGLYRKYMKTGMGSHLGLVKMPPPEFFVEITEMVQDIETEARNRQWPELLYYPVDEPSTTQSSVEFMVAIMKAIKKVPGVRTYVTADPSNEGFAALKPYVDVWCCQPFSISREQIQREMAARPGLEFWCYPNHNSGENDHTPVNGTRMTYGFGLWRSGFRCLVPWIYQSMAGDPWNYLDSSSSDFDVRTDDDGTPIPVTIWEAYREGIDDGRYINTLEKLIRRCRSNGLNAEADAAQADLELIEKSIYVQPKYKFDDLWQPETFDVYRWMLASRIMQLQKIFQ